MYKALRYNYGLPNNNNNNNNNDREHTARMKNGCVRINNSSWWELTLPNYLVCLSSLCLNGTFEFSELTCMHNKINALCGDQLYKRNKFPMSIFWTVIRKLNSDYTNFPNHSSPKHVNCGELPAFCSRKVIRQWRSSSGQWGIIL